MAEDLCQCPDCGRMHEHLGFGKPPSILARDEIPTDDITRTLLQEERRRLYQSIEELRAALRPLAQLAFEVEGRVFRYHDNAGEWRNALREAIAKARAVLGEDK